LSEALLWVAFQRLPTVLFDDDNREIRGATEYEGYEIDTPGGPLSEDECRRAKIPTDPHFLQMIDERPLPIRRYEELEPKHGYDEALRMIQAARTKETTNFSALALSGSRTTKARLSFLRLKYLSL
jgi:hypothetical protein